VILRTSISFLFLFPVLAQAAGPCSVSGKVLDPAGAAVAGAKVKLSRRDGHLQRTARADASAGFQFEAPCAAEYLLEAAAPGFDPAAPVPVDLRAGESTRADLRLALARVDVSLTVTASGTVQTAHEVAKAVDRIDHEAIDRRGVFSLVDAIRLVPGVRVLQLGGPGSFAQVLTRGLRAWDTAVLIDGFRFRDGAAVQGDATGYLGDLLLVNSDRVELLRGSGSSLYGTNAVGGVIHVISDPGGGATRGAIQVDGGGLGMARGLGSIAGAFGQDRWRYSAGLSHLNLTRGVDGDDRYRNTSGHGFLEWSPVSAGRFHARLFGADTFLGLNDLPFPAPAAGLPSSPIIPAVPFVTFFPNPNDPDSRRAAHFLAGQVSYTHRPARGISTRVGYQGLVSDRDNLDGPAGTRFEPSFQTANRFFSRIDTAQARADFEPSRRHLFSSGYEFEREFYDNHTRDRHPDPALRTDARVRIAQNSHTLHLQDQIRLVADRLQLAVSGRWQTFRLARPEFAGGAPRFQGIRLQPPPDAWTGDGAVSYLLPGHSTKLRAHAGNGYRIPSLYERFGTSFFGGSFSAFGDPHLRPERTIAFDAGFDQYLMSSRYRVSGTFFYTRLQEVIGFGFAGYLNTGGGLARGLEVSLEARPTRGATVHSSYTYTNSDERTSRLLGGSLRVLRVFDHMFTLSASQSIGRWDATVDFLAASDYISAFFVGSGNRPYLYPGPRKADLVIARTLPIADRLSLRLYGKIENFLNQTYYEDGFLTPKAWAVFGIKFVF